MIEWISHTDETAWLLVLPKEKPQSIWCFSSYWQQFNSVKLHLILGKFPTLEEGESQGCLPQLETGSQGCVDECVCSNVGGNNPFQCCTSHPQTLEGGKHQTAIWFCLDSSPICIIFENPMKIEFLLKYLKSILDYFILRLLCEFHSIFVFP